MSIQLVMPFNHLILSCPPLLLPSIFPSIRVFANESVLCIRWLSMGVSASASVLPMNIQDRSPLGWTGWISFSPGDSQEPSPTSQFKSINSSALSFLYSLSHTYMTTGENIALTRWTFSIKPPIFIHVVANGKKFLMAEYYSYIHIPISLHIHLLMDT